jgi:hypothetical protein
MKVKRITLEVEVPMCTVAEDEILYAVRGYLERKGLPHQAQVSSEVSPNTQIGNVKDFDDSRYYLTAVEYRR